MSDLAIESGRTGFWGWKCLKAGDAMAEVIPARGALLSRWEVERKGKRLPLFWLRQGAYEEQPGIRHRLPGGIPALFPVCGATFRDGREGLYLVEGKPCVIEKHGFGSWMEWRVAGEKCAGGAAAISLVLRDTEKTRECYPFEFETAITYTLRARSLRVDWTVENRSRAPMPMYPGLHPYYSLPFTESGKRGGVEVITSATTEYVTPPAGNGWGGETKPLKNGTIRLGDLAADTSLMVGDMKKPEYVVKDPACEVSIRATWPAPARKDGGPYLNFWVLNDEVRMFCVEPFMAPTNALNHKRGLIEVAPGEKWEWWFEMEVLGV